MNNERTGCLAWVIFGVIILFMISIVIQLWYVFVFAGLGYALWQHYKIKKSKMNVEQSKGFRRYSSLVDQRFIKELGN